MKNKYIYGITPDFLGFEIDLTEEKDADVVVDIYQDLQRRKFFLNRS